MKFFHVYNEECFKGLEKNGLLNKNTGFKIQHAFSVPLDRKFNIIAQKGGKLHELIKSGNHPFYVDRIAGGAIYHKYDFDKALIDEYVNLLGNWFLGFQLHESGSNRRNSDWQSVLRLMEGNKGPNDAKKLRELSIIKNAKMPDGTPLPGFSQDTPEVYASMRYAETPEEYIEEMKELFTRRMEEVGGRILPCDSYYLASKIQNDLGMKTFMPEVGCQIPLMRIEVALARGTAKSSGKTWGTYYECWREIRDDGKKYVYCMPCFNSDKSNEWYLSQEQHGDDFTTYGENGGSSRLLQNRIYYYALMSGADYFSEEWGLNCSYTDMKEFTLSEYGEVKKDFINTSLDFEGLKAVVPFAIVLPKKYSCVELEDMFEPYEIGLRRDTYMRCPLSDEDKNYYGHIEDVLKLIYSRKECIGNEGHVITNSRFGDLFDIIYEDADEKTLSQYEYLIDATKDGDFAKAKEKSGLKILKSDDFDKLEREINELTKEVMPCFADDLCWLVSKDNKGRRFLSIFNNEGNERSTSEGNIIHKEADKKVKITLKEACDIKLIKDSFKNTKIEKTDDFTYYATIPAAGFAVFEF